MKKYIITLFMSTTILFSCNEGNWLKEEPIDFMSPENAYTTTVHFQQAVNHLYDRYRHFLWAAGDDFYITMQWSDIAHAGYDFPDMKCNNYKAYIVPEQNYVQTLWTICYQAISNANVILSRLQENNDVSEADRKIFRSEALFFRALFFSILAHVYGGVPLITERIDAPKRDFTRNTRAEVYEQCREDLEEAVFLLDDIENLKDGRLSKQAAQHLLTEIYICLGRYQEAINAASAVIDHQGMALMTERFGSRKDEPGDVYWDLFRVNNQNRSTSGNTESIWVIQYEYQNAGSSYSCHRLRHIISGYSSATVEGKDGGYVSAFTTWTAEKGGRGIGCIQPNPLLFGKLWDDPSDIRNSDVNIIKDFRIDNPNAKGFGEWIVKDGWLRSVDTIRCFYPSIQKFSRTNNFPEEAYDKNGDGSLKTTALGEHPVLAQNSMERSSFKDEYAFRLAETYLLRAEAYLGAGQKDKAAEDISTVRARAKAAPVTGAQIDIDFILDERMRELYFEEMRLITLTRLGKMVERTRKYNRVGQNIGEHQNLWPIPYGEIEKNILAGLEQNPGYK